MYSMLYQNEAFCLDVFVSPLSHTCAFSKQFPMFKTWSMYCRKHGAML